MCTRPGCGVKAKGKEQYCNGKECRKYAARMRQKKRDELLAATAPIKGQLIGAQPIPQMAAAEQLRT